jgi:hypothetical protein
MHWIDTLPMIKVVLAGVTFAARIVLATHNRKHTHPRPNPLTPNPTLPNLEPATSGHGTGAAQWATTAATAAQSTAAVLTIVEALYHISVL